MTPDLSPDPYLSIHIQSQHTSAVLPDVKQAQQVQRPHHTHQHQTPPKRQSIDLLDLAFGPSSPERPPAPAQAPQAQVASGGFAADPFASQPGGGLGASVSASQGG